MEAHVARTFSEPVTGSDGNSYVAKICVRHRADGRWESWIEFIPPAGHPILRSTRETTQASLRHLEVWVAKLSRVYVEGALLRTLRLQVQRRPMPSPPREAPHFNAPSPDPAAGPRLAPDDAVLNPILAYRRGESHLRNALWELSPSDLRTVAWAYGIDRDAGVDVRTLSGGELVELILAWSRKRAK